MSNFTIFNETISFPDSADRYYMVRRDCRKAMQEAETDFANFYRSAGNIRTVLERYADEVETILRRRALDVLHKKLPEIGIYDVTAKAFEKACWNVDEASDAFDEIVDLFNEIEEELAIEKAYREDRKDSRGQWVGGGFGLGGAIKGAMTAGALNAASGLGHSLVNAMGNASSERAAANAKERLYNSDETYKKLCLGVKFSVWDIYTEYMKLVNTYFEDADDLYFTNDSFDEERAEALFDNAKAISEKREELLVKTLGQCPYYAEALAYIFERYPDERKRVSLIADYYCVDLSKSREVAIRELYKKAEGDDEVSLLAVRTDILAAMETYGIKSSKTLDALDERYMQLVFERHYETALPGERDRAVALLRDFDTQKRKKEAFIKKHLIWELRKVCHVAFEEKKVPELIKREYCALRKAGASEERIGDVLDEMLTILDYKGAKGFASDEKKEDVFWALCDVEAYKQVANKKAVARKEEVLAKIIERIESADRIHGLANSHLECKRGEANRNAGKLKFIDLEPGEYVLIAYRESPGANDCKRGFAMTDRRFVSKGDESAHLRVGSQPTFKEGGFFSGGDITATAGGRTYDISAEHVKSKDALAKCLEEIFKELMPIYKDLKAVDSEWEEEQKKQLACCIRDNEFLVRCFDMQKKAEKIFADEEAVANALKVRQIDQLMKTVKSTEPNSIAEIWVQLCTSEYEPELYQFRLEELFGYLCGIVQKANVEQLGQLEIARETISQYSTAEMMEELKSAMEARREEAERLHIMEQIDQIMSAVVSVNPHSVAEVWMQLCASEYEPALYETKLDELFGYLQRIAETANLGQFEQLEAAREKISRCGGAEKMQELKSVMDDRREEAKRQYAAELEWYADACAKLGEYKLADVSALRKGLQTCGLSEEDIAPFAAQIEARYSDLYYEELIEKCTKESLVGMGKKARAELQTELEAYIGGKEDAQQYADRVRNIRELTEKHKRAVNDARDQALSELMAAAAAAAEIIRAKLYDKPEIYIFGEEHLTKEKQNDKFSRFYEEGGERQLFGVYRLNGGAKIPTLSITNLNVYVGGRTWEGVQKKVAVESIVQVKPVKMFGGISLVTATETIDVKTELPYEGKVQLADVISEIVKCVVAGKQRLQVPLAEAEATYNRDLAILFGEPVPEEQPAAPVMQPAAPEAQPAEPVAQPVAQPSQLTQAGVSQEQVVSEALELLNRPFCELDPAQVSNAVRALIVKHNVVGYFGCGGETFGRKFPKAAAAYAPIKDDEIALVIEDQTIFGSAKEGFVLTDKNIYINMSRCKNTVVPLVNATGAYCRRGGGLTDVIVSMQGGDWRVSYRSSDAEGQACAAFLTELIAWLNGGANKP